MGKAGKLDAEVRALPMEIRYSELAEWLEDNGWVFVRVAKNNHRFWRLRSFNALSIPLTSKLTVERRYIAQVVGITDRAT